MIADKITYYGGNEYIICLLQDLVYEFLHQDEYPNFYFKGAIIDNLNENNNYIKLLTNTFETELLKQLNN